MARSDLSDLLQIGDPAFDALLVQRIFLFGSTMQHDDEAGCRTQDAHEPAAIAAPAKNEPN
eukprot:134651-Prymnesium_polylepis.1